MKRKFPTNPLIQEILGENHPIPLGWQVLVQTYDAGNNYISNGEESIFERPDSSKERDAFHVGIGRVIMMGDACLKAKQYKDWKFMPEVGDFVEFQKYEGVYRTYLNADDKPILCQYFKDYLPLTVLRDPTRAGHHHFIGQ